MDQQRKRQLQHEIDRLQEKIAAKQMVKQQRSWRQEQSSQLPPSHIASQQVLLQLQQLQHRTTTLQHDTTVLHDTLAATQREVQSLHCSVAQQQQQQTNKSISINLPTLLQQQHVRTMEAVLRHCPVALVQRMQEQQQDHVPSTHTSSTLEQLQQRLDEACVAMDDTFTMHERKMRQQVIPTIVNEQLGDLVQRIAAVEEYTAAAVVQQQKQEEAAAAAAAAIIAPSVSHQNNDNNDTILQKEVQTLQHQMTQVEDVCWTTARERLRTAAELQEQFRSVLGRVQQLESQQQQSSDTTNTNTPSLPEASVELQHVEERLRTWVQEQLLQSMQTKAAAAAPTPPVVYIQQDIRDLQQAVRTLQQQQKDGCDPTTTKQPTTTPSSEDLRQRQQQQKEMKELKAWVQEQVRKLQQQPPPPPETVQEKDRLLLASLQNEVHELRNLVHEKWKQEQPSTVVLLQQEVKEVRAVVQTLQKTATTGTKEPAAASTTTKRSTPPLSPPQRSTSLPEQSSPTATTTTTVHRSPVRKVKSADRPTRTKREELLPPPQSPTAKPVARKKNPTTKASPKKVVAVKTTVLQQRPSSSSSSSPKQSPGKTKTVRTAAITSPPRTKTTTTTDLLVPTMQNNSSSATSWTVANDRKERSSSSSSLSPKKSPSKANTGRAAASPRTKTTSSKLETSTALLVPTRQNNISTTTLTTAASNPKESSSSPCARESSTGLTKEKNTAVGSNVVDTAKSTIQPLRAITTTKLLFDKEKEIPVDTASACAVVPAAAKASPVSSVQRKNIVGGGDDSKVPTPTAIAKETNGSSRKNSGAPSAQDKKSATETSHVTLPAAANEIASKLTAASTSPEQTTSEENVGTSQAGLHSDDDPRGLYLKRWPPSSASSSLTDIQVEHEKTLPFPAVIDSSKEPRCSGVATKTTKEIRGNDHDAQRNVVQSCGSSGTTTNVRIVTASTKIEQHVPKGKVHGWPAVKSASNFSIAGAKSTKESKSDTAKTLVSKDVGNATKPLPEQLVKTSASPKATEDENPAAEAVVVRSVHLVSSSTKATKEGRMKATSKEGAGLPANSVGSELSKAATDSCLDCGDSSTGKHTTESDHELTSPKMTSDSEETDNSVSESETEQSGSSTSQLDCTLSGVGDESELALRQKALALLGIGVGSNPLSQKDASTTTTAKKSSHIPDPALGCPLRSQGGHSNKVNTTVGVPANLAKDVSISVTTKSNSATTADKGDPSAESSKVVTNVANASSSSSSGLVIPQSKQVANKSASAESSCDSVCEQNAPSKSESHSNHDTQQPTNEDIQDEDPSLLAESTNNEQRGNPVRPQHDTAKEGATAKEETHAVTETKENHTVSQGDPAAGNSVKLGDATKDEIEVSESSCSSSEANSSSASSEALSSSCSDSSSSTTMRESEDTLVEVSQLNIGDTAEVELRRRALALLGIGVDDNNDDQEGNSSESSGSSDASSTACCDDGDDATEVGLVPILRQPKSERSDKHSSSHKAVTFRSNLAETKEVPAWDVEEKIHLFYDKEDINRFRNEERSRKSRKQMKQAFQMTTAIDSLPSFWG